MTSYLIGAVIGIVLGCAWVNVMFEKRADARVAAEHAQCEVRLTAIRGEIKKAEDGMRARLEYVIDEASKRQAKLDSESCWAIVTGMGRKRLR